MVGEGGDVGAFDGQLAEGFHGDGLGILGLGGGGEVGEALRVVVPGREHDTEDVAAGVRGDRRRQSLGEGLDAGGSLCMLMASPVPGSRKAMCPRVDVASR